MCAIQEQISDLIQTLHRCEALAPQIEATGRTLIQSLRAGHKILSAGNGGSAADATHLAEELVARFLSNRRSLPAICLNSDGPLLTCIGNDFGFEAVFSRQLEGLGCSGDVFVAFSTSGQSANLIQALRVAREKQITCIALLGKDGGAMKELADHAIVVPSSVTARIQEVHTLIMHLWMHRVEQESW
ncbi:MAG TPA: SIS domain-containing protein [Candidatus Paceibacterota bacterium]|nr:SIS domain-containing protein [Verrucomicrobiota bacterium]HRY50656.1 SIS domain-containing protein [Candidatus Paceibacterota bacterium]